MPPKFFLREAARGLMAEVVDMTQNPLTIGMLCAIDASIISKNDIVFPFIWPDMMEYYFRTD
jgi:hypothetical protein